MSGKRSLNKGSTNKGKAKKARNNEDGEDNEPTRNKLNIEVSIFIFIFWRTPACRNFLFVDWMMHFLMVYDFPTYILKLLSIFRYLEIY